MSFYNEIADYYDLIFPFNSGHVDFVKSCVGESYQVKKLLDVGCGTGDLAIALSDIGFHVIGIDYDSAMLGRAERKRRGHVVFMRIDMRHISSAFSQSSFDAVLCFGNTLVHLSNFLEVDAFCKQVKTVLNEKGKFLLQILNYDYILDRDIKKLPLIEDGSIKFERTYEYDDAKNMIAFKTKLIVKETGREIENEISLYPMRKSELTVALINAGFTEISFYADFNKSKLEQDSLPLVVQAL